MSVKGSQDLDVENELVAAAAAARQYARADHSKYAVGAALQTAAGKIYTGCNIENASLGLTMCAERVALFKALSEGETTFACVAIVTGGRRTATPCGPCRQLLWEFCGDISLISATLDGARRRFYVSQLLPDPFDNDALAHNE